jgi:hypothetical protein
LRLGGDVWNSTERYSDVKLEISDTVTVSAELARKSKTTRRETSQSRKKIGVASKHKT